MRIKQFCQTVLILGMSAQLMSCSLAGDIAQSVLQTLKDKPETQNSDSTSSESNATTPGSSTESTKDSSSNSPSTESTKDSSSNSSSTNESKDADTISKPSNSTTVSFLSTMENEVVEQLNFARTEPAKYAQDILVPMKAFYKNGFLEYPGEIRIVTNEGISALEEAIEFMKSATPVGLLAPSKGMSLAAKDHVNDQSATGETGHNGSDGSDPFSRLDRYGQWQQTAGENIDYGNNVAQRVVTSLIIDDGVSSRGHRTNIMKPAFKSVGLASGTHPQYRHMFVQTFAGGFAEK